LDESIAKYRDLDAKALSELSHDTAWHSAWDTRHNTVIPSLDIAKAGNASKEFLEYLKEQEAINSLLEA